MNSAIKSGAIYKLIQDELTNLPGEKAHLEMVPYRSKESLTASKNTRIKESAVLCLLTQKNKSISITLMERTIDNSPHSGQISFPGGKMELFDKNLNETALRETHEEIGIHPSEIIVLGQLTPFYIPVSNFQVTPFIGYTTGNKTLKLSKREVKTVFEIDIQDLINPIHLTKKDIPNHLGQTLKNIPCFLIDNRVIWGATSLILNEVKLIYNTIENQLKKKHLPKK
ncbi:MAG: CoA pyrophosphatase [Crocinitomicaceae bacterium]